MFSLIAAWVCAGPPAAHANDVLFYILNKGRLFAQTNTAAPVLEANPFSLYAFVADRNLQGNNINSVTLDFPGGSAELGSQATERKLSAVIDVEALSNFPSQASLDGNFPNGDYTFNFDTLNDGLFSDTLNLSGDSYPSAPHISNFAAAQAIDPATDFVLKWDAFPGGTANSLVRVAIYENTNLVFETGFLPGDFGSLNGLARSVFIPAYTLGGLATYHATLTFVNPSSVNNQCCGTGSVGYESTTKFDLHTTALRRSPSDIFPIAVDGVSQIAQGLAYGAGNYLVALTGRQNVDADDPEDGEVIAVLVDRDGSVRRTSGTGRFTGTSAGVAFGGENFLMVWEDDVDIFGQFVATNGSLIGSPFPISDPSFGTESPDVASDGTNFLVVWAASDGSGGDDINLPRARLIAPDGTFLTGEISLGTGAFELDVGFGGGKFLVVMEAVDSARIYGQFLDTSGALSGSRINIDTTPARSSGPKDVLFDQTAQRFVVTFQDAPASNPNSRTEADLFACTVALNGPVGARKTIGTGPGFTGAARIASDGHALLFTWVNNIFSSSGTSQARFFDSNLNPLGAEFTAFAQHGGKVPFLAPVQFDGQRFLIVNSAVEILTDTDGDFDFVNGDAYGRFIVPAAPGIATQPRNQIVADGAAATFKVEATGPPPLTYQWQRNGVNVPGATSNVLVMANASVADAGTFRVLISNSSGTTISESVQLSVLQPPTIVQQPQPALLANLNDQVEFGVVAGGSEPLSYQWHLNGINIPGETSSNLVVTAAIETQGSYSVTVANPVGATNSSEASLTVQADFFDFKDAFAQRNTIEAAAAFGGSRSGHNVGATKETGEPNHAGKTGGASAWVGWVAPGNGVVTFATTGSGFDTLLAVYTGTSVDQLTPVVSDDDTGGFFTSFVTFNVTAGTEYALAIDGLGGQTGGIFLSWYFQATLQTAPVIVASPASRTVSPGSTVSLEVALANSGGAQFQWFKDGVELFGAVTNPLVIAPFQLSDVGSYVVRVSNGSEFAAFSELAFIELGAALTTHDKFEDARLDRIVVALALAKSGLTAPSAGTVITHNYTSTKESGEPNHGGVIGGASRWFVIQPTVSGALAIDTIGSDFDTALAVYTGASLATVTLITQNNDGAPDGIRSRIVFTASAGVDYYVAVDGVNGAQGTIVLNYFFGAPPQIVTGPIGKSVTAGQSFTLNVIAAAAPDLSYRWRFNGVPIPGATNAEFLVGKCLPTDQGTYAIEVSNPLGTAARAVNIAVVSGNLIPITITKQPLPRAAVLGKKAAFKVAAKGSKPITYQWLFEGTPIPGATLKSYKVLNVQSNVLGNYSVRVTNPAGSVESNPAALTLKP